MRHWSWHESKRGAQVFLAALLIVVVVAAARGEIRDGYFVAENPSRQGFGDWLIFATANTAASVATVVASSSVLGSVFAAVSGQRRVDWLRRALELTSTLPGLVLVLLWLATSPNAPLVVVTLIVAAQRTFQVAFLVNETRLRSIISDPHVFSSAEFRANQLRQWAGVLWVAGAQSAGLMAAVDAATVLLGFAPDLPHTWASTLCSAASGSQLSSASTITVATLGSLALPGAFWILGESGVTRKLALTEQPPSSYRDSSPSNPVG